MSRMSQENFMQKPLTKSKVQKNFVQHKPKRQQKRDANDELSQSNNRLQNKFSILEKKFIKKVDIVHEDDSKKVKADLKKPLIVLDRQVETICEVLKYMLGEHHNDSEIKYFDQQKTCQNWEFDEILKQVSDTNLGDFIIKCPNPDNLSEELKEIYGQDKEEEQKQPFMLTTSQALQFYYDLFDIQTASKLDSQREHVAFIIAFYLLKFESTIQVKDEICATYIKIFNYFKIVEMKLLSQYLVIRQDQTFYDKHERVIAQSFPAQYEAIQCFNPQKSLASTDEQSWNKLKRTIYWNLNTHINREFQHFKTVENDRLAAEESMFYILMGKVKSISEILLTFPQLTQRMLLHIKQTNDDSDKAQKRNLFGGQYLKKTIQGQNIIWINSKNRPNDVTTLLRLSLIYKLVIKSKLFLRCFLSKDEQNIMLVVKTSEQILQNYAQKYKINMQVDLGATDLFSFEPVDQYMRPLRLHKYIHDIQFRQKYNIRGADKMSAEDEDGLKSIESQAITIYQKASVMNQDELRTKIIMDQFEADRAYDWISSKLNIDYIRQKSLVNEYNSKNPGRHTWELYFVYNKMIIQFTKRTQNLFKVDKKAKDYFQELQGNIGMILRLMFLKALETCNDLFYNFRQTRSIIPRGLSNVWTSKNKLKNIWHYVDVESPSGFCTYRRTKSNERMWRKFQINELKDRSKFFASERLVITNKVIYDNINLSKSLEKKLIIDYYPLHDPYVLKNIQINPYISNIKKKKKERKESEGLDASVINKMYSQYECELTRGDFTKVSLEQKLSFKLSQFKQFSADSVRYYCGEKIAFFFSFMKFLAVKAFPLLLIAMLIQILLWAEQGEILSKGSSQYTEFNNALIFIFTFVNIFWTTHLVQTWKAEERRIAQTYGVSELTEFEQKRVRFEGSFKRNFQTDELNYEYVPKWKTILKTLYTLILNILYVTLVAQVILLLFLFKTYLLQKGYDQNIVNSLPSLLVAVASQVFSFIYKIILKQITIFENHKTVSDYEGSLISKASLITFIINFYSIFIFAYFSDFLASSYICQIKTTDTNKKFNNCGYFVSSQLLSIVMVDMATTFVGAILPFVMFKLNDWLESRKKKKTAKFNSSMFESIDQFYEQQDKMESYMYNQQLDNSWQGYMTIVNVFAATALFAPALPFAYVMMFVTGIIRLHTSKYEVIYLKRRILPIKQNSINWWLIIIEVISYVSIITNVAYMIYTRQIFLTSRGKYFFLFIILFFALKYYLSSQYNTEDNRMFKRNQIKTMDLLLGRRQDKYDCIPQEVNTDIENVIYDEAILNRKFHNIREPNIRSKEKRA